MPALYHPGSALAGHPQGDAPTDCYYLLINEYHELQTNFCFDRDRYRIYYRYLYSHSSTCYDSRGVPETYGRTRTLF